MAVSCRPVHQGREERVVVHDIEFAADDFMPRKLERRVLIGGKPVGAAPFRPRQDVFVRLRADRPRLRKVAASGGKQHHFVPALRQRCHELMAMRFHAAHERLCDWVADMSHHCDFHA